MLNIVRAGGEHSYHPAFSVKRIVMLRYIIPVSVNTRKFWHRCRSFWTIYSTLLIQCSRVILADRNFRSSDGECYARLLLANTPQTITQCREPHRCHKGLQVVEGSTDKWLQQLTAPPAGDKSSAPNTYIQLTACGSYLLYHWSNKGFLQKQTF